jgi:hypothetical protein
MQYYIAGSLHDCKLITYIDNLIFIRSLETVSSNEIDYYYDYIKEIQ